MAKLANIAGNTWQVLLFASFVLIAGLWAMHGHTDFSAGSITALVTAVLGVVGTHVGHVAGHELAMNKADPVQFADGLERLAERHRNGDMTDEEFANLKRKLIDRL